MMLLELFTPSFASHCSHLGFQGKNAGVLGSMNKSHQPSLLGFLGGTSGKEPTCQRRRHRVWGSILGSGRSPGGGQGNPLQYSFLENPMDRGAWWATVHRVTKSQTRLSDFHFHLQNIGGVCIHCKELQK